MSELRETVYQESAPRIDADAGILYGVKLLGEVSRNGRRYKPEAMKNAVSLYDGRKSYTDHPDRESVGDDRKFKDWSGVFENVRHVEGKGLFADWHLRKSGEHFQGIVEAAKRFPNSVGLSHVAEGDSRFEGDTEIVESIKEVFSVDLVTDPATTNGIFESKRRKPKAISEVKQSLESLPEGTTRAKLIEMLSAVDSSYSADADDKPADPLSQMVSLVKELIARLGEALNTLAAAKKETTPPPAPEAPEDDMTPEQKQERDAEKAAFESLQRENAELKAKTALIESSREATPARVKALANVTDEAERKELLESWPQLAEGERPLRSPAVITENTDASPERIRETFAALAR